MKKLLLLSATLISMNVFGQSAEEKAWMAFMTPGDQHAMIAKEDGQWNESITFYAAPGAPPTEMKATCNNKMILGGRYQQSTHKGDMMGMPFEGTGIFGYDNARKVFFSTWIDNMGTGIMYCEGQYDAASKTIVLKGKTTDPTSGKQLDFRQTMKMMEDGTQEMEMFMITDGKEFKSMVIKSKRA